MQNELGLIKPYPCRNKQPDEFLSGQTPEHFQFGKMNLTIRRQYSKLEALQFELELHNLCLDFCNLPKNFPGKMKDGKNLRVRLFDSGLLQSEYNGADHTINFDTVELYMKIFPVLALEELNHASLAPIIHSELQNVKKQEVIKASRYLRMLPEHILGFIKEWAPAITSSNTKTRMSVRMAYNLAHEYIAKRETARLLYIWSGGNFGAVGLTDQVVAEYLLLSLAYWSKTEAEYRLWGSDFLTYPANMPFDQFRMLMTERIQYLRAGISSVQPLISEENGKKYIQSCLTNVD